MKFFVDFIVGFLVCILGLTLLITVVYFGGALVYHTYGFLNNIFNLF